jgi:hypothetical protein
LLSAVAAIARQNHRAHDLALGTLWKRLEDGAGLHSFHVLPFGLLLDTTKSPTQSSVHVLGTGVFRKTAEDHSTTTKRVRLFGIPIWTTRTSPTKHLENSAMLNTVKPG